MTLEGAQRAMRNRGKRSVSRSAELMERLQSVKSMLLEMREMLGAEESSEVVIDDDIPTPAAAAAEEPQKENTVQVIEPGRSGRLEEEKRAVEERKTEERGKPKHELPFYEQTLF